MPADRKIKVGIINCDLHAHYYSSLMGKYDPYVLRDDEIGRGHAAYFYFYLSYNNGKKLTSKWVDGFELLKFWHPERIQAENMVRIFNPREGVACQTLEEVSDGVDLVFIADCNGEGHEHLAWATPSLKKGVPTFVDKPFAYEYADAKKMVEMAQASGAPLMSTSMIPHTPHMAQFRNRFAELEQPDFGIIRGGGATLDGQVHAISAAQMLFGNGIETVECMGRNPQGHMLLEWGERPERPCAGVVLNCDSGDTYHCSMFASAFSCKGAIHSPPIGDFEFPFGAARVLELLREMVHTRKPPIPYSDMLECIAVAAASRLAHKQRRRVAVREVC